MDTKIFCFLTFLFVGGFASTKTRLSLSASRLWNKSHYDKISWFVHITDIHISSWEDDTRQEQVKKLLEFTIYDRVYKNLKYATLEWEPVSKIYYLH